MPLQNRLRPDGEIVAHPARTATLMGNRGGKLHDDEKRLGRRRWTSKAWIACEIEFRGRKREPMRAGPYYTELFALDEAVMLAAGHRPCYECRRRDARAFAEAWARAHALDAPPGAKALNDVLHAERLTRPRPEVDPASLPEGAMVEAEGAVWLILADGARRWSFDGYGALEPRPEQARLLTPPSVVATLRAGYRPRLHPSAHERPAHAASDGGAEPQVLTID